MKDSAELLSPLLLYSYLSSNTYKFFCSPITLFV